MGVRRLRLPQHQGFSLQKRMLTMTARQRHHAPNPLSTDETIVLTDPDASEETPWWDLARCAEADPEAYFPEKGGSTREAKKVCRACEVRAECLEYALANGESFGIWGGLSERERRRIRRDRGLEEVA